MDPKNPKKMARPQNAVALNSPIEMSVFSSLARKKAQPMRIKQNKIAEHISPVISIRQSCLQIYQLASTNLERLEKTRRYCKRKLAIKIKNSARILLE